MRFAAASDKGLVRENNEDCYRIIQGDGRKTPAIFIIADGMGGHNSGEVASRVAVDYSEQIIMQNGDRLKNSRHLPEFIQKIMEGANRKVFDLANRDIAHAGMGTTMILSMVSEGRMYTGHVGDSRLYLIRKSKMQKITQDHSLIEELVRNGTITKSEACSHPRKNIITKALGCTGYLQMDIYETRLKPEDILLLCTDGLSNMVNEQEILEILDREQEPGKACKELVHAANGYGGQDNITVIAVYI